MSIPRAKITVGSYLDYRGVYEWECTCGQKGSDGWFAASYAMECAREHLARDHGVRTVGSLTAEDIGRWIECDKTGTLEVTAHGDTRTSLRLKNDGPAWVTVPSSTPCRITDEEPA